MHKKKITVILIIAVFIAAILLFSIVIAQRKNENGFASVVSTIQNNFSYGTYEEIMNEQSHLLALPMEYQLVGDAKNFIATQKLFVYKHPEIDAVILLQVTKNASRTNEWVASVDYTPTLFNSQDSKFGAFFNPELPAVHFAMNSFSYNGCNFTTIAISKDDSNYIAASELMSFCNQLIEQLTNN